MPTTRDVEPREAEPPVPTGAPATARCSSRPSSGGPSSTRFVKLDPRQHGPQPGHVRRPGRQRADHGPVLPRPRHRAGVRRACSPGWSPSGCGSRCCSPTSPRPSPRAGARPRPTRCARPGPRPSPTCAGRRQLVEDALDARCRIGDLCVVSAGELIPGDGDVVEGIAIGRRVGHHRRVGAGHPRVRRRPLRGHRRHPGAVRRDRRADHRPSRARASSTG